ncbi:MAG: DUF4188 domain-containing protein [Thermomicrobiales bacterium]
MYSISLIFRPGTYDDDYDRLDAAISAVAAETEGYLGSEAWISKDGVTKSAAYYWSDLNHLRDFAQHVTHREAKSQFPRWFEGYQVSSPKSVRCTATAVSVT